MADRIGILELFVLRYQPDLVVLDGIRDLVADINDGVVAQDTIERLMPYYRGTIMPAFDNRNTLMVVAHGNSLRGIVKELKGMSNDEIIKFNLPTAVPYVFTFDERMNLVEDKFLGDPDVIAAKMQSVANQAKKK